MIVEHLTKEIARYKKIFEMIEAYGYSHPGCGFSCARMASIALGKEPRKPKRSDNNQCPSVSPVGSLSQKDEPTSGTKRVSNTANPDDTSP